MSRRRVLLLMKPLDVYPPRSKPMPRPPSPSRSINPKVLQYLDDRCKVHKDTINLCQDVLRRKYLDWEPLERTDLSQPIRHVDLVITVGGDGTLLRASHFLDGTVPVLGVNSDPTKVDEVVEFSNEFDATRSTGYLCAATSENFEQVLDEILDAHKDPSELSRISLSLNNCELPSCALNDVLIAHPCPAAVSRFSYQITNKREESALVNSRSSGLRVSTAAGSTAAMLSAGGFRMPILSRDLQYMVREPIFPRDIDIPLLHGSLESSQSMHLTWYSREGTIYIDGSHIFYSIQHGDTLVISSKAPMLKVYLPQRLLD